jgi:hypothetical protein
VFYQTILQNLKQKKMEPKFFKAVLMVLVLSMLSLGLQAQRNLLRKLQEKTEEKIVNEILGEEE